MPPSRRELPTIPAELVEEHVDREVGRLAARQHGVVARTQLRDLGVKDSAIGYRVAAGRLHRVHRGVYAVGHPVLGAYGRWMAAVLACGDGAALSHRSAAALWEIRFSAAARADVIVPTPGGRKRPGLDVHRHPTLRPDEVTTHHAIPVTTPARTLLDLAASLAPHSLERALDQAEVQALADYPALHAIARAHPRHKGATALEQTLRRHEAGSTLTRSELETRFLAICRDHALPTPRVNHRVADIEVDFLFAEHGLVVETDGWRHHRTRRAFERDRARDAALMAHGLRTLRVTHRRMESDAAGVAATLRSVLAA